VTGLKVQELLEYGLYLLGANLQGDHTRKDSSGLVEISEFDLFVDKYIPNIRALGETVVPKLSYSEVYIQKRELSGACMWTMH
jgi:hypothetical protein